MPWLCRVFGHAYRGVLVVGIHGAPSGLRRECKRCEHGEWVDSL